MGHVPIVRSLAVGGLLLLSACSSSRQPLEWPSSGWPALTGEPAHRLADSREAVPGGKPAMRANEPVVLRLGLADCLDMASTESFDAVLWRIKTEIADAKAEAATSWSDIRLTSSLDVNRTEQALEQRLTGDNRTREEQTNMRASVGVLRTFETGTTVSLSHAANQTNTNSPFQTFDWSSGLSVMVRQNLLDGFGVTATRSGEWIANADRSASLHEIEASKLKQRLSIAKAYWGLVSAKSRVTILNTQAEVARQDLARVKERRERGEELRLDELRAESVVAGHEEALVSARLEVDKASDALIAAINPEMLWGYALIEGFSLAIQPKDVAPPAPEALPALRPALQRAFGARHDLRAAMRRLESAGLRLDRSELAYLPKLDAEATVGLWGFGDGYTETLEELMEAKNRRFGLKINFEMPLENTADRAALRIARAEQEQAVYAYREVEINAIREVLEATRTADSAVSSILEAERAVRLAREEAEAVRTSRQQGVASSQEDRQAQARLTMKELDLARAKIDAELARLALLNAIGG